MTTPPPPRFGCAAAGGLACARAADSARPSSTMHEGTSFLIAPRAARVLSGAMSGFPWSASRARCTHAPRLCRSRGTRTLLSLRLSAPSVRARACENKPKRWI